ncbi:hypothetical protein DFJ77DRAFT_508703 [Powellomyces hirtus]|nr:hypothetical protein DFJ77DRAFT_508703 [Powellomyces hirtus]
MFISDTGCTSDVSELPCKYPTSFSSSVEGQAIAAEFISEGSDVIFGAGVSTGSAGIAFAARRKVFVIGVDSDESLALPFFNTSDTASRYILTSAMKRVDKPVYFSLKDRFKGTSVGGNRIMGASTGGVSLAPWTSAEAVALMQRNVPLIFTPDDVARPITVYRKCWVNSVQLRIYRIFNSKIRITLPQNMLLLRAAGICAVTWRLTLLYLVWTLVWPITEELVAVDDTDWVGGTAKIQRDYVYRVFGLLCDSIGRHHFATPRFLSSPPVVDTLSCLVVEMSQYTMLIAVIGSKF